MVRVPLLLLLFFSIIFPTNAIITSSTKTINLFQLICYFFSLLISLPKDVLHKCHTRSPLFRSVRMLRFWKLNYTIPCQYLWRQFQYGYPCDDYITCCSHLKHNFIASNIKFVHTKKIGVNFFMIVFFSRLMKKIGIFDDEFDPVSNIP